MARRGEMRVNQSPIVEFTYSRSMTCRTKNLTHAHYWPSAFNANHSRHDYWFASNVSCLRDALYYEGILTFECVLGEDECNLDATLRPNWFDLYDETMKLRSTLKTRLNSYTEEYTVSNYTHFALPPQSPFDGPGYVFRYRSSDFLYFASNNGAVFFFREYSTSPSWLIVPGIGIDMRFSIMPALRVSIHEPASSDMLLNEFRTDTFLAD